VIVVNGLVEPSGVVHDPVKERDAALPDAVRELEFVEDLELPDRCELSLPALGECRDAGIRVGIGHLLRGPRGRGTGGGQCSRERGRREQQRPAAGDDRPH